MSLKAHLSFNIEFFLLHGFACFVLSLPVNLWFYSTMIRQSAGNHFNFPVILKSCFMFPYMICLKKLSGPLRRCTDCSVWMGRSVDICQVCLSTLTYIYFSLDFDHSKTDYPIYWCEWSVEATHYCVQVSLFLHSQELYY